MKNYEFEEFSRGDLIAALKVMMIVSLILSAFLVASCVYCVTG